MHTIFYQLADPMMIVEYDFNRWYIRDINKAFTGLSGYRKHELLEVNPEDFVKDSQPFGQLMAKLIEDDQLTFDCELTTRSTMTAIVRLSCRKFQMEEQTYYMLVCKDVSAERWGDEFAVDHKIMMAIGISEQFRIFSLKRYFAPLAQGSASFLNRSIFDLVAEEHRAPLRRIMERVKSIGKIEHLELHMQLGDGKDTAKALIKPFYSGNKAFHSYLIMLTELNRQAQEEDPSYKLRMLMLSKNISATSLSRSTLISLTTISKIRNGKIKKPQRLTAELIASELGVKPEAIWSSFKQ
ncbi:helix-turn-helix domain-containing protein [Paenibacillus sp. KS-LC4]|uniref:helix-turn-helix domain-containing protein n=1 Tax=Paenibacillus sp. KS-LC4 TaxID=2979727 RepID=UPI0030CF9E26